MQELTPNGYKFIRDNEGCVLHPYLDSGNTPTIGFGNTYYPNGTKVTMSDPAITQADADAIFQLIVIPICDSVQGVVKVPLNSNELCALTDFAYNCGINAFRESTLLQHVNNNCVVESDFTIYDHVKGSVDKGLLNRRISEYHLYCTPVPINNVPNVQTPVAQPIKTMEPTEIVQVLKVSSIVVTFDRFENGEQTQTGATVNLKVTPELLTAMKMEDAGLVEAGYNVTLEA